ncbi:MAG: putative Adenylyltransferase [Candidatus Acidoferrum typicum]|nr:putative Adenylyltransferase [Candidatus Acidoferrum typicum]
MISTWNSSRSWVLRNAFLRAGDLICRQGMVRRLSFLERAQWWRREEVERWRNRSLQMLIDAAHREVPFYRSLFDERHLKVGDIKSPLDLRRLPIVTKNMLRAQYPQQTTRDTGLKTYEVSSSGSTGNNFWVTEDAETAGQYRASFMLALEWAGWQVGEPHMQTGITPARSWDRQLKDWLLCCHYVSAYELDDTSLDAALDALESKNIRHLWGYPGSLYFLARRAVQKGWNRPLKTLVTWGDNLYQHYRSTIENAFGTRVRDTYGCGEGFQIAAQCGVNSNYHLHSLDVIVEFLDDEGNAVPDGQLGNIVVTRLHPGPMPLIRYRIGDVGISGGGEQCSCGRGFELLASVQGRDTDIVVTPSGNRLIVHFFTGLIERFREINCFQVVQEEIGSMVVRVVPSKPSAVDNTVKRRLISTLQKYGATDIDITVETTDHIPTAPSGKRRFVVSKVASQTAVRPQA